jgi:hypothetical protein
MAFDEPAWPQTEFQLPDLDSLVHEGEPPPLDADLLAQFLSAAPPPTDFVPQMPSPASLQLTSSGGSSGTSTKPTSEEDRKERARALNRAKQARFRARQKVRAAVGLAARCLQNKCLCINCCAAAPVIFPQERKAGMAQQYEAACADLERETELNASMKLTSTLLEAVKSQKDFAVEALEAASRGTCLALNKQGQEKEGALQSQQQGAQVKPCFGGTGPGPRSTCFGCFLSVGVRPTSVSPPLLSIACLPARLPALRAFAGCGAGIQRPERHQCQRAH